MKMVSDKQYANGQHHFYGVWDWDMNEWNNKSMEAKYVALNTSQAPSNPINTNNLLNQMVVNEMAPAWYLLFIGSLTTSLGFYLVHNGHKIEGKIGLES